MNAFLWQLEFIFRLMAVFLIHDPRSVFIHIPKTGGASIRHGFFQNQVDGPKQGYVPSGWHRHFKFAFVRNPYDRLISAWQMFSSGMRKSVWQQPDDLRGLSLSEFLSIVADESVDFSGDRNSTPEKIRHHTIPQTHPFNCLEHADFAGRFETLEADFARICQRLKIPFDGLPHWNQSQRETDVMHNFDQSTLALTNDFFHTDFVQLGYKMVQPNDIPSDAAEK